MKVVRELVSSGKVGEVKSLSANFGYVATTGDLGRHLNPELSGGALLDVGIYPLAFAQIRITSYNVCYTKLLRYTRLLLNSRAFKLRLSLFH